MELGIPKTITEQPIEITNLILSYLRLSDIISLSFTCKYFYNIVNGFNFSNHNIFKKFCKIDPKIERPISEYNAPQKLIIKKMMIDLKNAFSYTKPITEHIERIINTMEKYPTMFLTKGYIYPTRNKLVFGGKISILFKKSTIIKNPKQIIEMNIYTKEICTSKNIITGKFCINHLDEIDVKYIRCKFDKNGKVILNKKMKK